MVSPAWSPDGRKLAFATVVEPTKVTATAGGRQDIWVTNLDGTGRQRITQQSVSSFAPFWVTTSRIYFVSDRAGRENIWSTTVGQAASPALADDKTTKSSRTAVGSTDPAEMDE